jgi:hypothetical protein
MLILQSFTNSPKFLAGLCSEKSATLSGDAHERVRIKAEATDMDIKVEEMSMITVEEATFMDIKEEKISVVKFEEKLLVDIKEDFPGDVTCPTIKAEHDQVSYICVSPFVTVWGRFNALGWHKVTSPPGCHYTW